MLDHNDSTLSNFKECNQECKESNSNLDSLNYMSSASTIEGLDLILLMSGCKLYNNSKIYLIINYITRIQCIALLYWVILIKIVYISSDPDPIFTFNISIIHIFQLLNQHYLLLRSKQVRQLHQLMVSKMTLKDKKYLRKLTFLMVIIWILASLFSIITYHLCILNSDERILIIYNFYSYDQTAKIANFWVIFITRYLMLFFFAIIRNSWQLASCFLFYYLLQCLQFYDEKLINNLINDSSKLSYVCKVKNRVHIDKLKNELESKLNLFPLLWFTFNFISMISIMIVLFKSSFEKSLPTESVYTFINITITFIVLYKIDSIKNFINTKYDKLICITLNENNNNFDTFKYSYLYILRNNRNIYFTACNIFQLNKGVILPFVGSLVSFSVLFVQLSQIKSSPVNVNNTITMLHNSSLIDTRNSSM